MKPLDRAYQQAARLLVPLMVHFDLTYRCHQRCVHCYLPEGWRRGERAGAELDAGQVKGILDQLSAAGTFFLTFSGGEVFLRPDLMELLAYARRCNFSVTLLTTGTRGLGPQQCRTLSELGLEAIFVSLYSLKPEVHDHITQTLGSWARLMRAVADCRAARIRVGFNCAVSNLNYREVPALKAYADREGSIIRFDSQLSLRWDGRPHRRGLALTPECVKYLQNKGLMEEVREPLTMPPTMSYGCNAGIIGCYIGPTGEVWPCIDLPWPCGSLHDGDGFEHIWRHSGTMARVRRLQESLAPSTNRLCVIHQQRQNLGNMANEPIH